VAKSVGGDRNLREVGINEKSDWREGYMPRRATCGGQRAKTYIDIAIQKQANVNTIIQLEQKKRELNIIGTVQENGRLKALKSIFEAKKNPKKRWLLVGGVGAGKTVCLKEIALGILSRLLAGGISPQDKSYNLSSCFESYELPIYLE